MREPWTLDQGLVERYLPEKALGCFSLVKPSEAEKTLESVSGDLFHLVQRFTDDPQVSSMYSYRDDVAGAQGAL